MRSDNEPSKDPSPLGIAIVGMACVFPQAPSLRALWRNIVLGVDAVGEPPSAWEASRYLDSGRIKTAQGGYLHDLFRFDPHAFGIMPNSLDGGEPDQFLALRVAHEALRDAGYLPETYDHQETGVVLGHSTYLHRGQGTLIQNHIVVDQTLDLLRVLCPTMGDDSLGQVREVLSRSLPACTADIAPGLVPNVMTGRIANRLDLRGPNYLIDAACSSSLLAVAAAMDELRAGRSRMMLAGGVNASLPAEVSVIFTQLGALSGRGKVRPFEAGSDGTLLGEGLGIVALKRVEDALHDGDRIYAVLRGVGQASDGRGKGLLAPTVEGEALAIRRAYQHTGVDPASVSLIEAHGTGIPLGDKAEIAALAEVFGGGADAAPSLPIGSIKSMISHCIPAAGIAGLIKASLALHHKVLPPTLCDTVNPELGLEAPLYINTRAAPWIHPTDAPRRAGINSFGFGGINTHAIVEEAPPTANLPPRCAPWSSELCVFSAPDKAALVGQLVAFRARLREHPEWSLDEIAAALVAADAGSAHRLALVAADPQSLDVALERAVAKLAKSDKPSWFTRKGAVYCARPLGGKLAFLFPGEGSQYLGMLSDLAMVFDDVRQWLDFWSGLYPEAPGHRRTDIAYPPESALTPQRRQQLQAQLQTMDVGSEAVFVGGQAMHALLHRLGVVPDVMLGHSSGESSALAASGALGGEHRAQLAVQIRRLNALYREILADGKIPTGALLTVGALPLDTVKSHIADVDADVVIAMHNCVNQLVLYGATDAMDRLGKRLTTAGGICMRLPFDRGYHTPAFGRASAAFRGFYDEIELSAPDVVLYSCASAAPFPDDVQGVRDLAARQWSTTVRFQETVEQMFADGVTTFIEVGPSGNLTSFVGSILAGAEHLALATNVRGRGGLEQVLAVVGQLYAQARPLPLERLFDDRQVASIDVGPDAPTAPAPRGVILDNTMPKIRLGESDVDRLRALVPAPVEAHEDDGHEGDVMPEYFDLMRSFLDAQSRVAVAWQATARFDGAHARLLETIVELDEAHIVAECRLSVAADAFVRDHVLSGEVSAREPQLLGLSCVPLMVSLEIMAQACAVLAGTPTVHVIENVRALGWVALDEAEVVLRVRARRVDAEPGRFHAEIVGESGVVVTAEFCFEPCTPQCAPLHPLAEHRPSVWNDDGLYTCGMFHGPIFQSIRHIDGWDDAGIDAQLSHVSLKGFFTAGEHPPFVLNPVLLDAMGQLSAYWLAQYAGTEFNCFPSTVARIELYGRCPQDEPGLQLRARQRPVDPASTDIGAPRAWDFEYLDAHAQPRVRVTGLHNVYFAVPPRFYEVRRDPQHGWLGRPTRLPGREDVTLWELELFPDAFCAQSEGIFLRILAHVFLGATERRQWRDLELGPKGRRRWLLGRACIKEAVRYWIHSATGELLHPSEVQVTHDAHGAPHVDGWWRGQLLQAPAVSLSHDDSTCIVALANPVCRVGVDREVLGRIRTPRLLVEALTPAEKAPLAGLDEASLQEPLLRIWCAKEAAAKFLGVGLQGVPSAFEVEFGDTERCTAHVGYRQSSVYVDLVRDDTAIIALASELQPETS